MKTRLLLLTLPLLFAACRGQIQHGLDERDANEIVTELVSRGFDAKKVPEKGKKPTWAIDVPDDKATDALRVLTGLKLPRKARKTTQALVDAASLIETPQAEKLRALEAQEGDIEEALRLRSRVEARFGGIAVSALVPTTFPRLLTVIASRLGPRLAVRDPREPGSLARKRLEPVEPESDEWESP